MVKLMVRDRETIQEAVRRFRKLVERSGIKKEMRRREYYEKPSEIKRRSRLRAERRARRTRQLSNCTMLLPQLLQSCLAWCLGLEVDLLVTVIVQKGLA